MTTEKFVRDALLWYGAINEKCRIEIIGGYSEGVNIGWLEVEIYYPRSRKPDAFWSLCIDLPRSMVDFDNSKFNPLKPTVSWRNARPYMSAEQLEDQLSAERRRLRVMGIA